MVYMIGRYLCRVERGRVYVGFGGGSVKFIFDNCGFGCGGVWFSVLGKFS